eukprot:TRINITY_DN26478_c0_g2_i1.p1 TRINITY_DN26478_c0_g2~~TRINITY_DN26478_c0_g2_i1.p1  ORF type:complete len:587 (-),score=106.44 TRINITY_DN26478_c0_g2_i1:365-2125(-)
MERRSLTLAVAEPWRVVSMAMLGQQHDALEKAMDFNRWIAQAMTTQEDPLLGPRDHLRSPRQLGPADLMPVAARSEARTSASSDIDMQPREQRSAQPCYPCLTVGQKPKIECQIPFSGPEGGSTQEHHVRNAYQPMKTAQEGTRVDLHTTENGSESLSQPLLSAEHSQSSNLSRRKMNRVFEGVSNTKKLVMETLSSKTVTGDEYAEDGFWPYVVRAEAFKKMVYIMILLNTIWIGVDTDYNHADSFADASLIFQVADSIFCAFFLLEIIARLLAFCTWQGAFANSSFLLDFSLVVLYVWQTWLSLLLNFFGCEMNGGRIVSTLRIVRLFRLTRIARLSRVISLVPELEVLSKGMAAALRGMLVTLSMLLIIIYIFAIMFTQLLAGTPTGSGHFDSILQAMNFMLLQVLCGFDADFFTSLAQTGLTYYFLWLVLHLVASLVLMNMLVGILVDMVSEITEGEKDTRAVAELEYEVEQLDTDGNRVLTRDEVGQIVQNPAVTKKLDELGVDVAAFAEFAEFVFQDQEEMDTRDFVYMAIQFRGEKNTTVKDVVDLRKFVTMEVNQLETILSQKLMNIEQLVIDKVRSI